MTSWKRTGLALTAQPSRQEGGANPSAREEGLLLVVLGGGSLVTQAVAARRGQRAQRQAGGAAAECRKVPHRAPERDLDQRPEKARPSPVVRMQRLQL
jgi:hypothetical protein